MSVDTRFIAWPDTHIPFEDKKAVSVALKIVAWYQPQVIVILGDFLDCTPVSHWLKSQQRNKTAEGMRLKDDFAAGNRLLDKITAHGCKKLVYLEGNHEDWIHDAIERNPEFDGLIDLDLGLRFAERRSKGLEIVHLRYNKCWKLGKLWFTHGLYTGQNHAKKHVEAYARNIVYGHLHDVQLHVKVSPVDIEDKKMGLSLGCLADRNPQFMENRPNNWVHALGVGMVRANGNFNIDPIIISGGEATYAGKTFKG